jgi:hypothetical protein
MSVTSTTIGGVNCWQFSGAVTQAEITTAWSALLVNGEYTPARALYFDDTCDMRAVQGGFNVNMTIGSNCIILHTGRNKANTVLRFWNIRYSSPLSVGARSTRVMGWNGTGFVTLSSSVSNDDGIGMFGGSHTYAVIGNPGGGDPRYLDECAFGLLGGGVQISSSAFTEQELQPDVRGIKEMNDVTFTRCFGFPQLTGLFTRAIMWRCYQNTMHPSQKPIRLYDRASVCYVDSTMRRNNVAVTSNLLDAYGSSSGFPVCFAVYNNWQDESWFGASKTTMPTANWNTGDIGYGAVMKKLQFVGVGAAGTVKVYDSRSTTAAQRSTFVGTSAFDYIDSGTGTQTDANGKVWLSIRACEMNASSQITRYTGQKYTFQAFGYRVAVTTVDVTAGGDDNTSPYAPVVPTVQTGLSRTQAAINAATTIDNFQQLLEELHVLAIGLSGSASYAGTYIGNLFAFDGGQLTTAFTTVSVDATASSKISYDSTNNAITIKSSTLAANGIVGSWVNSTGTISTTNGATITGTFSDSTGTRITIQERTGKLLSTYVTINGTPTGGTVVDGTLRAGWVPLSSARTITVQPTDQIRIACAYYGSKPAVFNLLGSEIDKFTLSLDAEPAVDTTISTTTRDDIAASFFTVLNGQVLEVTINRTMVQYTPVEVIAGLDYYIVARGDILFGSMAQINTASLYALSNGTIISYSPAYKIRMADLDANGQQILPSATGYEIPLVIYYQDPSTGAKSKMTILNAYGAFVGTAPWTQTQASIGDADQLAIAVKTKVQIEASTIIARETTVATRASQASVDALGTPMQASSYTAPDNTGIAAIKAKTDNLPAQPAAVSSAMTLTAAYDAAKTAASQTSVNAIPTNPPTVAQIRQEIDTNSTKLDVAVSTRASQTSVNAIPTAPTAAQNAAAVRTELTTELGRIDVAISTRSTLTAGAVMTLTTAYDSAKTAASQESVTALGAPLQSDAYTTPDNTSITAIKDKVDTLTNAPTVGDIEASTILAKETTAQSAVNNAKLAAALSA